MKRSQRPLQLSARKQSWSVSRTTTNILARGFIPIGTATYTPQSFEDRMFGDPKRDCHIVRVEEAQAVSSK